MKEKPKAKQTGKPKAKRAETTRGAQTARGANPSAANGAAQGAAAGKWCGKMDGETEAQYLRRAFEWDGAALAAMGAASWRRWKKAHLLLSHGFRMATEGAAGYDEILNRPEMLRAVECLINDPPEIAQEF